MQKKNVENYHTEIINEYKIEITTLKDVFETYIGDKKSVDFLSIDTEGFEIQVLEGNDWEKYSPKLILIEVNDNYQDINQFLKKHFYQPVIFNGTNAIYFLTEKEAEKRVDNDTSNIKT